MRREKLVQARQTEKVPQFPERKTLREKPVPSAPESNARFPEIISTDKATNSVDSSRNVKAIPCHVIGDNVTYTSTVLAIPAYTYSVGPDCTVDYPSMPSTEICPICDHHIEADARLGPRYWR